MSPMAPRPLARGLLMHARLQVCDWRGFKEARRDIDALKGHRQTVFVLGRYTLTYWPWEVVRKLLLRRATRRMAPDLPPPPLP